ncbi:protein GRAVITROPIC IN THE LIGHT 1-like [Juglans microcarpa x Juglans regia]|uniref:protein GRAVITROPIC IN THE LIGHT 1-like n=1 Tax=Juglans microcarpa x Juglans regia TaxID=2249226 RepID=UPI001B7D969F|nr:protein GRAVITROPIC IN THE LIGHT 1-like [Juglans microcarpa x Juglans regia]
MPDADGSSKPPQISDMFQKFAQAFKSKTFEFFAEIEAVEDSDGFSLLDSAEEVITDQKVVVIKPDPIYGPSVPEQPSLSPPRSVMPWPLNRTQNKTINTRLTQTVISSIFATVSSFEASYFQLQAAHVPFAEENVKDADRALVSHLQRLSEFKQFYKDCCRNQDFGDDLPIGSCMEARVEENQSKLRILGNVSNRLQSEIDQKDNQVLALKKKLGEIQKSNFELSKRLSGNLNSSYDVLLSVRVFDSVLLDACRATHRFTKILIELMRKAMWDLGLAANSVYADIEYAKEGHSRYAFLSYVSLLMFKGFHLDGFGVGENEIVCNGHVLNSEKNSSSLKQLLEHVSSNPVELLSMNRKCEFAKFCETKYQELIHPIMESSIFSNLDRNETMLNSWKSLSVFYDSFVRMASSIWTLHKLAFSFDPVVEIFKVERGMDFSMVYMEDVTRRFILPCKTRAKVGFTVVPGFKIVRTIIQSQVYLSGLKYRE